MPSITATVRVPTASSSARSCETSSSAPSKDSSASSSASRLSMSRWFVGSSRMRTLAPEATRIASDSRRRSPPLSPSSGFWPSSPLKRKRPSSARAFCGVRPVWIVAASATVRARPPGPVPSSSACWERWPIFTLWPVDSLPAASGRLPASVSMSVVLPAPLGPTSDTCSPRSSQTSASSSSTRGGIGADLDAPAGHLEDDAPAALGRLELELQPLAVARVALDALDLVQPLDARLRLLGLRRLRAEALDELLEALDLGLLLVDRAAERDLARGELLAPLRPRAGEEARAAGLELEHRGADGLEEPAVVGDEHDRRVERLQRLLEPLERLDVEVVRRLVEQQQVGVAGERAGQRGARQLAAGERLQRAVEVGLVVEAQAAHHRGRAVAPRPAAGVLEARLGARVGGERRLVAVGHRLREAREVLLDGDEVRAAAEDVVAQREVAVARRALVVQRDLAALLEGQVAAVDRRLAGEHPQQRRLAGAVAPGDRQPLTALELEGHAPQQRVAGHVLAEVGCDENGHGSMVGRCAPSHRVTVRW